MKILMVHNAYRKFSGEEAVVRDIKSLLLKGGHEIALFERSSDELESMSFSAIRAFFCGIYNASSIRRFKTILQNERPDIIHIHNLYPLISPSILNVVKDFSIPIVMTVHNYRLDCPNGLYFNQGEVCERCHGGKEYWCVLRNCERNVFKSLGYALRNWFARITRAYAENITAYVCLTEFQRNKLVQAGYPESRMTIIPNMVQQPRFNHDEPRKRFVGFVGRISSEKGVSVLAESAYQCPDIFFSAAGNYDALPGIEKSVPNNFTLLGHCNKTDLENVYQNSRFIVLPSICYEGFPTVLVEAMLHGKAIVCSNIGGLPDIVDDGVTGLLVEPGNAQDLTDKIRYLWERPELCEKMGLAGREKALEEYSEQKYYDRLMDVYSKAQKTCNS